jgi:hypothetical protein
MYMIILYYYTLVAIVYISVKKYVKKNLLNNLMVKNLSIR